MGTVRESRAAGIAALVTAGLMLVALLLASSGPESAAGEDVLRWFRWASHPFPCRGGGLARGDAHLGGVRGQVP